MFYGVPNSVSVIVVYATLALAALLAVAYKFSGPGLRARAARDAPLAAETIGIPILRARIIPWTMSAFVMGVGGALYVHQLTAFSPSTFGIGFIIPIVVMAVLGGMKQRHGCHPRRRSADPLVGDHAERRIRLTFRIGHARDPGHLAAYGGNRAHRHPASEAAWSPRQSGTADAPVAKSLSRASLTLREPDAEAKSWPRYSVREERNG